MPTLQRARRPRYVETSKLQSALKGPRNVATQTAGVSTFRLAGLAHTFEVCVFGRRGSLADLAVCASRENAQT
jgi:hypothetical protein